jgi:Lar family restriction alleviation protein
VKKTSGLLPCPFCGGEAIIDYVEPHTHFIAAFMPDSEGAHFIECTGCTAAMSGGPDREKAIAAWNKRSEPKEGGE